MIPLLGTTTVTRLRYPPPTVVQHQRVRGAPTSTSIRATVAPASQRTMARAPEGIAVGDLVTIASYDEIRAATEGGAPADRVVAGGVTYEVQAVTHQPPFLGQPEHWEADALRLQAIEVPEPEIEEDP